MRHLRSKGIYVRDGETVGRRVIAEGQFKNRRGKLARTVTYSTGKGSITILRKSFLAWLNGKEHAFVLMLGEDQEIAARLQAPVLASP